MLLFFLNFLLSIALLKKCGPQGVKKKSLTSVGIEPGSRDGVVASALASHQYVPVSFVGWVCCWFSSLLREVFLQVLRFSPLLKNQHFQILIRSERTNTFKRVFRAPKCFVGKQITLTFKFFFTITFTPRILITDALPTELRGRPGAGCR